MFSIILTEAIAERAAEISNKNKIPAADSIIYTSALSQNSVLLTSDNDFRGLKGVKFI